MANWFDGISKKKNTEHYDIDNDDNFNNDSYYSGIEADPEDRDQKEKEKEPMDDRRIGANNRNPYSTTRRSAEDYMTPDPTPARKPSVNVAGGADTSIQMTLVKPVRYLECQDIADKLLSGGAVIMNLENTDKETAANLIYFLTGVLYAIEGHIKPVSANTYMLTPGNMEITDASGSGSEETDFNEGFNG